MNHRALRALSAVLVLAAGIVANPPPGQLLAFELGLPLWLALVAVAALAGVFTVFGSAGRWSYVAWVLLALPLVGPVHEVFSLGTLATAAGAVGAVLLLELVNFETRRQRWANLVEDGVLEGYERKHRATWLRLGLVLAASLTVLAGLYAALLQIAPPSFADSIEARQVEGVAGPLMVALLVGLGVVGLLDNEDEEELA